MGISNSFNLSGSVAFLLSSYLVSCPQIAAQEQRAILMLTVNQVTQGQVFVFLRSNNILILRSDLEKAGLHIVFGLQEKINNENYIPLASLAPSIKYEFDEKTLELRITAQANLLGSTSINLENQPPKNIISTRDTSWFFNYAFNLPISGEIFNTYTFFGESGLSFNGNLLYSSFSHTANGLFVRGLTNFTLDHPQNLTRWVWGDSLANSGNLGGGILMGGLSISREFGLNPYFVRQPSFGLSGAVLTPSTVEIYVNGQRVSQQALPPGQFQINNLLLPTGSGSTKIVLRDAFGQEQVINSPFYFSAGLLKPGISDYSLNLGFLRNNLNSDNFNYSSPVFLGRYSQGITKNLTLGERLEASTNLVSAGSTITTSLPFGSLELSLAASNNSGVSGAATSIAYSYSHKNIGFSASTQLLSDQYANLSLKASDDRPRLSNNISVSTTIFQKLNVGLQYTSANYRFQGQSDRISLFSNIGLTRKANFYINLSRSSAAKSSATEEILIGFNYHLGNATATSLNEDITHGQIVATLSVQKSAPVGEGFGYQFQLNPGESNIPGNALLTYRTSANIYELNYNRGTDGQNSASLNISGSIVAVGNNLFFARPVTQSFGLIQVPGYSGVRGYVSNQEIGRTNSQGNLLIPDLIPYYGNNIRIADQDIPLNNQIDANEKIIAPAFRSGAVIRFPVQHIQSALGKISLEISRKTVIPAYGQLTLIVNAHPVNLPIGEQGEFYLENIPPGNYLAKVEYIKGICNFDLKVTRSEQQLVNLGNVKCIIP